MVAVILVVFVMSILFYSCRFGWSGVEENYVYENKLGLYVSTVETDDYKCCYICLNNDQYNDFIDYYDVQIVEDYYIDDMHVLNAYSKFFDKKIQLNDKKYNLQIAFSNEILVGYPQLYMGF